MLSFPSCGVYVVLQVCVATKALVKGGGGALLREKMVELRAKTFVVIVDESKLCPGAPASEASTLGLVV